MFRVRDTDGLTVRGLMYDNRDINKLIMFPGETLKHFAAKAILFRLIRKKLKHNVISEFIITGCGVGDLLDLTVMCQYEIECHGQRSIRNRKLDQYKNKGIEIIVVDCSKLPDSIKAAEEYLEKYLVLDPIPMNFNREVVMEWRMY